ncbi:MAG: hypothetical protein ACI8P0_000279 [Planctomycetaceae bacterium]|jgi:hypothetical protein
MTDLCINNRAGNQFALDRWFPACAGMTWLKVGKLFRTRSLQNADTNDRDVVVRVSFASPCSGTGRKAVDEVS